MSETATQTIKKPENFSGIKEPEKSRVVILNDNATPMEFVIELLKVIFHHSSYSFLEVFDLAAFIFLFFKFTNLEN